MKKLLITSMAAVAVSICAKAEFTDSSENFESTNIGPLFEPGEVGSLDEGKYIVVEGSGWSTAATPDDGVFTVTNINHITKKDGYPLADGNDRALAIDTSASLMRNAVKSGDASQTGYVMTNDESIFFDSLVQFTATESIPTPSTGDKLVIGLFADEDPEVNADLGALDNATNLVVISAVLNPNTGEVIANATNIIDNTDLKVGPEEWHRLTIQVMNNSGFSDQAKVPGFKVFVDEVVVKDDNGEDKIFHSLVKFVNNGENVLKGVAFEGKGAVDDLVFTTTDPLDEGGAEEPTIGNFSLNLSLNADEASEADIIVVKVNEERVDKTDGVYKLALGASSVKAYVECATGYKIEGATYDSEGELWIVPINVESAIENETLNVTITVVKDGGSTTPTVAPGQSKEFDTEEAAKKVTITVTDTEAAAAGQTKVIMAVVKQNGNKWVVTAEINTEATGYIPADTTLVEVAQKLTEIANATEDNDGNVTVALSQVTPGLYYSVDVSDDLAGENQGFKPGTRTLATSDGKVTLKVSKPKGNSAFFKVVQHLTKQ